MKHAHLVRIAGLVALSFAATSGACQRSEDSAPPIKSQPAQAVALAAPSKAEAPAAPSAAAPAPPGLATDKPADPNRMPRDALHAPFRGAQPVAPAAGGRMLPAGHPPIPTADRPGSTPGAAAPAAAAPMAPAEEIEAGQDLPLPLTGPGGADELKRRLEMLGDDATRARVEAAFRQTFTVERDKRDPLGAAKALEGLADDPKAGAVAARIMGYVAVSNGFDVARANAAYRRAIALDPGYGEAHYALAFMLSMNDREAGRVHFDKAMELGVPDIRGIGRFYPKPGSEGASE